MKIKITVNCPQCRTKFAIGVTPAELMGAIKSKAKAKASRENGKKGGRPRKNKEK